MKRHFIHLLIIALILIVSLNVAAEAPQNTVVRIGHLPIPGQVLYYIALKEGYFKEEGLDVQLTPITSSVDILNALNAGKFDLASAGTAAPLTFIAKGAPFQIVGGLMGEGTVIQVNTDSAAKIHSIKDFKGKKIATVRLATGDVILRGQLAKHHILNKVEIVEFKSPTESLLALKTGRVDLAVSWPPYSTQAELDGTVKSIAWTGQWAPHHTCCRLVTTDSFAKEHPDTIVKVLRGLIKAQRFFNAEPEKSVQLAADYLKVGPEIIRPTLVTQRTTYVSANPDKKMVVEFWKYMNEIGYLQSNLDIKRYVNESFYKKASATVK